MESIITLLINAVVVLIAAYILPKVEIRNFGSAILVALLIGVLNWLLGWLLNGVLHVATLGLFALTGLSFIIRLIATAIVIKIVDAIVPGFKVHGFLNAIILAAIIALVGALVHNLLGNDDNDTVMQLINNTKAFLT